MSPTEQNSENSTNKEKESPKEIQDDEFGPAGYKELLNIVSAIKAEYKRNCPFTDLGSRISIYSNPKHETDLFSKNVSQKYIYKYINTDRQKIEEEEELPPHIFALAGNAFRRTIESHEDVSVIFLGDTKSGKTQASQLLTRQLVNISLSISPDSKKLLNKISYIDTIFGAFGTYRQGGNSSSSLVARYTELQYDEKSIIGAKIIPYILNAKHLTHRNTEDRNFNIFHYWLAGASKEEIIHFKLVDAAQSPYVLLDSEKGKRFRQSQSTANDRIRFLELRDHMKSLGFDRRLQFQIFRTLSIILHLGLITFAEKESDDENGSGYKCVIKNPPVLELVAELMGARSLSLSHALTARTCVSKNNDVYTRFLTKKEAEESRDNVLATIYSLLFSWIIETINMSLCKDECISFIGVVDFPGFCRTKSTKKGENSVTSNFEVYTLLRNYANECLVNFFCGQLSCWNDEYLEDGIRASAPKLTFQNPLVLLALGSSEDSLLSLLEKNARKPFEPKMTNNSQLNQICFNICERAKKSSAIQMNTINVTTLEKNNSRKQKPGFEDPFDYFTSIKDSKKSAAQTVESAPEVPHLPFPDKVIEFVKISNNGQHEETVVSNRMESADSPDKSLTNRGNKYSGTKHKSEEGEDKNPETDDYEPLVKVKHYGNTQVLYNLKTILNEIPNEIPPDMLTLILGSTSQNVKPSANHFLKDLISDSKFGVKMNLGGRSKDVVTSASSKNAPHRTPSFRQTNNSSTLKRSVSITRMWKEREKKGSTPSNTSIREFVSSITTLMDSLSATVPWFVLCVDTSETFSSTKFNSKMVESQLERFGVLKISQSLRSADYGVVYTAEEFVKRYKVLIAVQKIKESSNPIVTCEDFSIVYKWTRNDASIGRTKVFLSDRTWQSLENQISILKNSATADIQPKVISSGASPQTYNESHKNSSVRNYLGEMDLDSKSIKDADADSISEKSVEYFNYIPEEPEYKPTRVRKLWLCITYSLTWCFFPYCISACGMRMKEVQVAWREKVAFNIIIYLMSGILLFIIIGLSYIICPAENLLTIGELSQMKMDDNHVYVYAYGVIYNVAPLVNIHQSFTTSSSAVRFLNWSGLDVSPLFTLVENQKTFDIYCPGFTRPKDENWTNISSKEQISPSMIYVHNQRVDPSDDDSAVQPYLRSMREYQKHAVGWVQSQLRDEVETDPGVWARWVVLYGNVYDMSKYFLSPFFKNDLIDSILNVNGKDVTKAWNRAKIPRSEKMKVLRCMNELFYRGIVDRRNSFKCRIVNYVLIGLTGIAVAIIGVKYVAAFKFLIKRSPELQEKFVVCLVTCYTEDRDSLKRTIDSIAKSHYDDRFKLIFIIADGMVIGHGCDKYTPEILMDILKIPPTEQNEELYSFNSIGEGGLQNNYALVNSGIYREAGHTVAFILVVKVGGPADTSKAGNRGKRDSHLLIMNYLNKVNYNSEMNPLELKLYSLMTETIGVNPLLYEYLLMVDADTVIDTEAINMFVSKMTLDSRIVGICGETRVSNAKQNWVTMMQVYEYYISHSVSKIFESVFGSVTCLPGCFCMYRIRNISSNTPYLISNDVVKDYGENLVNTLHLKNLLMLGEDRYLTTLMMKHFPKYKTSYSHDAKCETNVPDSFNVLTSQRRRWINSTVHNLIELLTIPQLCGVCLFSMRFVVLIDMLTTFVQPAGILYVMYLVVAVWLNTSYSIKISLIMICVIYGLQSVLAILRQEWELILWLVVYILSLPYFGMCIPLYAFWNFDNFSWGTTRSLKRNKKGEKVVVEPTKFDQSLIPLKKAPNYVDPFEEDESGARVYRNVNESQYDNRRTTQGLRNTYNYDDMQDSKYKSGYPQSISVYQDNNRNTQGGSIYYQYGGSGNIPNSPNQKHSMLHSSVASVNMHTKTASNRPETRKSSKMPQSTQRTSQGQPLPGEPSASEMRDIIENIILSNDLTKLTKGKIREELSNKLGLDLSSRRAYISSIVDEVLQQIISGGAP